MSQQQQNQNQWVNVNVTIPKLEELYSEPFEKTATKQFKNLNTIYSKLNDRVTANEINQKNTKKHINILYLLVMFIFIFSVLS